MSKLYSDRDKYGYQAQFPVVEAYNAAVKDLVRKAFDETDAEWSDFVFGTSKDLITKENMVEIEKKLLDLGHRFDWSAAVSVLERPEIYKPAIGFSEDDMESFMFDHPDAPKENMTNGRQLCGKGDNVACYPKNLIGIARYIRSPDQVLDYLNNGVPEDTIALIDDSGGTLTAPILQQFKGVICAGGSTRSHLGILSREYGVPCLMNSKVSGIKHNTKVEVEISAPAKTAAAYASGKEMTVNIWLLEK